VILFLTLSQDNRKQVAFIGRTNLGVFEHLHRITSSSSCLKRIGLVGGIESYNFDDYLDIYYLMTGSVNRMKKYKAWKSYAAFKAFATNVNDIELLSKIKIIEKFGQRLPSTIEKIQSSCCKDPRTADVVLSTVHKAKGLEFDNVILLDDFPDLDDFSFQMIPIPEDEKNLLYVAITRAKQTIVMNDIVKKFILNGEGLRKVIFYKSNNDDGHPQQCSNPECKVDLSDDLADGQLSLKEEEFMLFRRSATVSVDAEHITTSNAFELYKKKSQLYCSECTNSEMLYLKHFLQQKPITKTKKRRRSESN